MFFAKITNQHSTKNRLQEYVSKQLKSLECLTVTNTEEFKNIWKRRYTEPTARAVPQNFPGVGHWLATSIPLTQKAII